MMAISESSPWQRQLLLLLSVGCVCAWLTPSTAQPPPRGPGAAAFVAPPAAAAAGLRPPARFLRAAAAQQDGAEAELGPRGRPAAALLAGAAASLAAALAVAGRGSGSRLARQAYKTHERKWWFIEEDRDPTTLPVWQRDYRYGFQVLKRTMVAARKKGEKVFWEVRVLKSNAYGCQVEMLNSGLMGWCPRSHEGPKRLKVGDVVQMECTACPQKRVNKEPKHSPWPNEPRVKKANPYFSHWLWLEQQSAIQKAKELKAGDIVDGVVYDHIAKGLLIELEGEGAPKGMLAMMDISRKMSSHRYVDKMFPKGTPMKCYVVHADTSNGRITLSTKEFEDDDHMGWMLSFPERCFANAEHAVGRYHQKREAYIKMLQR